MDVDGGGFHTKWRRKNEDVAEGLLNELIRRSLIQVARTLWEKVARCRVHDLLRDLAVQKASELNFFHIYDPRKHSVSSSCIRHALHGQGIRYLSLDFSNLKLRSVMFFCQDFGNTTLRKCFSSLFRHLHVLYLNIEGGSIIPDAIGSLYHLKFLTLSGDSYDLPSSIGHLKNLQTLFVETDLRVQLPPETADLVNIRHLVARYSEPLIHIRKLTSLQVLKGIQCDQWKDVDPVDLGNLRELSMGEIKNSYSLNNISSLKKLSTLGLSCQNEERFPSLEFLNSCQKLHKLLLFGRIEKLPLFPNSITMMLIGESKLMEDPMPILGRLPNLRNLKLMGAVYEGTEIMCSDNSFSQLEFLYLYGLPNLERWHLATNAMPLIKGLYINECPRLNDIPKRMKDVKHIQSFIL